MDVGFDVRLDVGVVWESSYNVHKRAFSRKCKGLRNFEFGGCVGGGSPPAGLPSLQRRKTAAS